MNRVTLFALVLVLAGCADRALFVTNTQIGMDVDTQPGVFVVGYDRYEGFVGPVYENGAVPAVAGRLETNLKIFEPEIREVYATGEAAEIVTGMKETGVEGGVLDGKRQVMLAGAATNIGLKLSFLGGAPESLNLGFKRKTFSVIPIMTDSQGIDRYGSVLATIDFRTKALSFDGSKVGISEYFATGNAAEELARDPVIRRLFKDEAREAVSSVRATFVEDDASVRLQDALASDPAFQSRLDGWMAAKGISVSSTLLIFGDAFTADRAQAVQDLL